MIKQNEPASEFFFFFSLCILTTWNKKNLSANSSTTTFSRMQNIVGALVAVYNCGFGDNEYLQV